MKLTETRPCDNCDATYTDFFYIVDLTMAIFNPQAANQVVGLNRYFQGHIHLAEMFAPEPDVVILMSEKDPTLNTRIFLCSDCCLGKEISIAELMEKVIKIKADQAVEGGNGE